MNTLTPLLAPAATFLVGCMVAYIAWQQWRVAKSKLRFELFDRRYRIYDATRNFLAGILSEATFSDAKLFAFYAGTSDAEFLFGTDIMAYLKQVRERAVDMRTHQKKFEPLPVGAERSRHVQAHHDQLVWFGEQTTEITKVFAPYLGFSHIK